MCTSAYKYNFKTNIYIALKKIQFKCFSEKYIIKINWISQEEIKQIKCIFSNYLQTKIINISNYIFQKKYF
jgi:hypothetical protein